MGSPKGVKASKQVVNALPANSLPQLTRFLKRSSANDWLLTRAGRGDAHPPMSAPDAVDGSSTGT
jgi:hypothetical protein